MSARPWTEAEKSKLRRLYPNTPTRDIKIRGKTFAEIKSQCANLHLRKSEAFARSAKGRRRWTAADYKLLRKLYPDHDTVDVAKALGAPVAKTYAMAARLGIKKTAAYKARLLSRLGKKLTTTGAAHRFPKGHVPANKGLRRPGWHAGRMKQTQFKKGQWPVNKDPDFYVIGALRVNADGYIDMRVSFEKGGKGWRGLHRILWEDAHGPIPPGHILTFKDRDKLNVELANLELLTLAENMRRNTVHNLPKELAQVVQLRGALMRQINRREREKQN